MATALRRLPLEPAILVTLPATILAVACSASWSVGLRGVAQPIRAVGLVVLCALGLALALTRRGPIRADRRAWAWAAALVVLTVASLAWSVAPKETLERAGSFGLVIVTGAALAAGLAGDPRPRRQVLLAVLAGAGLVAAVGLGVYALSPDDAVQPATGQVGTRFRGLAQNPNTGAMLFAIALPLAAHCGLEARSTRARVGAGAVFLLLVGSIVASGSRGALVPACIGLLVVALPLATRPASRAALVGGIAAFAAGAAAITTASKPLSAAESARVRSPAANPERYSPRDAQYVFRLEDEVGYRGGYRKRLHRGLLGTSGRLDAWEGAFEQGEHRALLGYGFGTEESVFVDRFQEFQGGLPENSFLGLFLQLGALGVALFVALVVALIRAAAALGASDRRLAAACLAVLAVGIGLAFVQSYVYSVGNVATLAFWVCAFLPTVRAAE